ncbi:MAG: prepilin-type N-terminal cleavage/methylation domain-containing protein, partial [bacterium]|nr:prepilin-type N-terminal cleavage/methylation domain-containing protein [bacterium]
MMRDSAARSFQGFTLIEVMVSIVIMSFVLTFAFQAYQGIQSAHERVSAGIDRGRVAGVLLDRIERELVGAVMVRREDGADPLLHRYVFVSADATLNQEGSDSLRFITQTPTRMSGASNSPGIVMVTYGVASEAEDLHHLIRVEEPVP